MGDKSLKTSPLILRVAFSNLGRLIEALFSQERGNGLYLAPFPPLFIMIRGTTPAPTAVCKRLALCSVSAENIISGIIAPLVNINIAEAYSVTEER